MVSCQSVFYMARLKFLPPKEKVAKKINRSSMHRFYINSDIVKDLLTTYMHNCIQEKSNIQVQYTPKDRKLQTPIIVSSVCVFIVSHRGKQFVPCNF